MDIQSDFVECGTRVMAPLVPADENELPLKRLEPVVSFGESDYVVRMGELVAVDERRVPQRSVHDLRLEQDQLKSAIDFLFRGF